MKVLIASLQVSESGSKGHLHPALELALEVRRRGHEAILLPLPSPFGAADRRQLEAVGIAFLEPPTLPPGVLRTPVELAALAASPEGVIEAYRSFLASPLEHQLGPVRALLERLRPDVVVYDLLVYAAPLAARTLGIPELGFCAGLKLVAPERLTEVYQRVARKLRPGLESFLKQQGLKAEFHQLELLSENVQLVFTSPRLVEGFAEPPPRTRIVGPLPASLHRGDGPAPVEQGSEDLPMDRLALLCFGSALDPADFPILTRAILNAAKAHDLHVLIGSRKLSAARDALPAHATARPYLPLPELMRRARVLFHHGGANTFSEALSAGVPQILIPLTTDQPIQGEILQRSGAGLTFLPEAVTEDGLRSALGRGLDPRDPIHRVIAEVALEFRTGSGAGNAAEWIERLARTGALARGRAP